MSPRPCAMGDHPCLAAFHDRKSKTLLLEESLPHLRNQLKFGNVRRVILNGREVLDQVADVELATLRLVDQIPMGKTTCSLYLGAGENVQFAGWSTNLQSSRGVSLAFRNQLAHWLAKLANRPETPAEERNMAQPAAPFANNGFIQKGTKLPNKSELFHLLDSWLEITDAPTIGDIGLFGGSPCILIDLGNGRVAGLNADTKRAAVEEYVRETRERGSDMAWFAIQNRRGRFNKLVFRADGIETPGWYCYLQQPLATSGSI
jgi:hypothetical protein